jgi:5-methylthioadenosine/S-adenosylhomocysteine deaminase
MIFSLRQCLSSCCHAVAVAGLLLATFSSPRAAAASDAATVEVDLLITNGLVFSMDAARATIAGGFVAIDDARIVAVGPAAEGARYRAAKTIDARGGIVMPGMINTHTHAAMTVFRGLGDDVADRLRRFIWPLEARVVDAELVYWGALHGMIEMVEGGVTSLVDSYPFPESTTRAAQKLGMRAFVAYPMKDDFAPFRAYVESLRGNPLITPVVGLHSPYAETPERIRAAAKLADELGLLSTMHVAEMDFELKELREKYQQTPIEYLDSLGLLGPRFIAAHAIFLTESDIALLAQRDVAVAHNMVANIKSAKGVAPVLKLRAAGVRVGLGTDGPMSGNTLDLIGQLGYVAKLHKLDNKDRTVMPAMDVVEMATLGGARTLRRETQLGSLEPGKLADVIIVDTESTAMVPLYDVATNLVYSASPRDVRTTIIQGRVVMEDRRLLTVDSALVRAKVREIMQRVRVVVPDVK